MKPVLRVASPPGKPVVVFDGECAFCARWVRRCQSRTGGRVEYLAFQEPQITAQFPEIPRRQFEAAVQFIQPDGTVCGGAEAAFRTLAFAPGWGWLLRWYQRSRWFAGLTERVYRFVARYRRFMRF